MPFVLILIVILQRKANKTMSIMSNKTIQKFEFSEDKILIVDQKGEDYYAETKIKYNLLFRAYETKKAYILYISNRQCFTFLKESIVSGDVCELNSILKANLGNKFIRK